MCLWLDRLRTTLGVALPPVIVAGELFLGKSLGKFGISSGLEIPPLPLLIVSAAVVGGLLLATWWALILVPLSMLVSVTAFVLGYGLLAASGLVSGSQFGGADVVMIVFFIIMMVVRVGTLSFIGAVLGVAIARAAVELVNSITRRRRPSLGGHA
jgi:hypothetical protein